MIGDVLTTSILFEALKTKFTNAELHYLINSHTHPVVENNPFIDKFIFFTPEIEKNKKKLWQLAMEIKKQKFDIVIDAYSKLSSNLITALSGAKTKISKYKPYTAFLYSHPINYRTTPLTEAGLAIENRLQLLEPLNSAFSKINMKPKIYLTEAEKEAAKQFLLTFKIDLDKPLFMISVLGSDDNKTYPLEYMANVLDQIVNQTKGQLLFNYIPKQLKEAQTVFNYSQKETQDHIYMNIFGKSLREFLALTFYCNALIGNEGGAVNMAKALTIPTFTIFSPWIDKKTWSIFENNRNVSVHLKDYKPELYSHKEEKELKKEALTLYREFKPSYFSEELNCFLKTIFK